MDSNSSSILANWTAIRQLAPERFDSFRRAKDPNSLYAIARYTWNMEVSKELHSKLHVLEVSLRNQTNNSLIRHYGPNWIQDQALIRQKEQATVQTVKAQLSGKPLTHDRIIAGLSFGFWTTLLGPKYDVTVGRKLLGEIFPHYVGTARLERTKITPLLQNIRKIRNRVSHFEAIAFDPFLPQHHSEMLTLIG